MDNIESFSHQFRAFSALMLAASLSFTISAPAHAQAEPIWKLAQADTSASNLPWVDAEVRRVDMATGRVSLRHAAIPNLDMAAMTMTFRVANPDWLQGLKEGDRLRIQVEKVQGAYLVQRLEVVR